MGIGRGGTNGRWYVTNFALLMGLMISLWTTAAAEAAGEPALLWRTPEDLASGESAGRLGSPESVAVDQETGNLYVSERTNARVSEFDPWGQFIRAWGWGVLNGSPE